MKTARTAWTLVETLVVVAIATVLLGILVPAVSRGLLTARETACLAAARSFAQAVHAYAAEAGDCVPAMRVVYPDDQYSWDNTLPYVRFDKPGGGFGQVQYPYQGWFSAYVLSYAGHLSNEDAKCPIQRRERAAEAGRPYDDSELPTYSIPEVFYFRTEVYERRDPWSSLPASYRVQRLSDVRFPGEKVLVFERRAWHLPDQPSMFTALGRGDSPVFTMTDGSARPAPLTSPPPFVYNSAWRYQRPVPWVTPSGVWGSDLRP